MDQDRPDKRPATRLIHPDNHASHEFEALSVPIYRASTVVFPDMGAAEKPYPEQYRYGIYGTPTARELMLKLGEIEQAEHVLLAPSGLAAISMTLLAFARSGGHLLLPASAYGPTREVAQGILARLGVETTVYDPMIGSEIVEQIRDNTFLVWCESPGSVTMEVQDVAAIADSAKTRGIPTAIDNTYGAGLLFDAFAAGCDVSVQALSKYQGGHSDVLMGSVATRNNDHFNALRRAYNELGLSVSPDDCSLVLRGLKTLDMRLRHIGESTMEVAGWLAARDEVTAILHPAFPGSPGHDFWKRDWTGSAGVFSIILGNWTRAQVVRFVEALQLFKIGYSWGGANSLVFTYKDLDRPNAELGPLLVRLNIGHEDPQDLIADIQQALDQVSSR